MIDQPFVHIADCDVPTHIGWPCRGRRNLPVQPEMAAMDMSALDEDDEGQRMCALCGEWVASSLVDEDESEEAGDAVCVPCAGQRWDR